MCCHDLWGFWELEWPLVEQVAFDGVEGQDMVTREGCSVEGMMGRL